MGMHTNGLPARILDVLETDGGWLTKAGLAHQLEANLESVERALFRLHNRSLVEHRQVELVASVTRSRIQAVGWAGYRMNDFGEPGNIGEHRTEWRFVSWGDDV